jgi:hypothetical protein
MQVLPRSARIGALVAVCALVGSLGVVREAGAAGGAYVVDTAEVSEAGSCKIESWISSAANHDLIAATNPSCVVSIGRPVEASVQLSRTRSDGEWGTAAQPKLKTNLVPSGIGQFGLAAAAGMSFDLLTGETTGGFAYIPATMRLSNNMRINLNAGWQGDRSLGRDYFLYGLGFDLRSSDNVWTLTGEMFGLAGASDDVGTVRPRAQIGLRYRPIDRFNIDLIYGRNLTGENVNWLTLATIIRFPPGER